MDKELVEYFQKNTDKIDKLEKDESDSFVSWIKHIITIQVGLLTLLVAFKGSKSNDCINHLLYSCILTVIAIGVFTGIVLLYHQVDEYKNEIKFQRKSLSQRLNGDINSILSKDIQTKKIFAICKYIFYISGLLTIILLVIYGIRIDI